VTVQPSTKKSYNLASPNSLIDYRSNYAQYPFWTKQNCVQSGDFKAVLLMRIVLIIKSMQQSSTTYTVTVFQSIMLMCSTYLIGALKLIIVPLKFNCSMEFQRDQF
jgi:hypothetical protein